MTTKNILVTSKYQITIPAEIARKMRVSKHDTLKAVLTQDNKLVLSTIPSLRQRLSRVHESLKPRGGGIKDDEELRRAIRETVAKHAL